MNTTLLTLRGGLLGVTLIGFGVCLVGCVVSQQGYHSHEGIHVSKAEYDKVVVNRTTKDEVIDILGEPTTTTVDGANTILQYLYKETSEGSTTVFLIFDGHNERTYHDTVSFTIGSAGTVTSKSRK